jgi:hypothetical protein
VQPSAFANFKLGGWTPKNQRRLATLHWLITVPVCFRPVANQDAYALIKGERSLTLLIFYIAYVYDRATLERATL